MKLYYITRVNIPSNAAQSVQIYSMCKAFNEELEDFKLISPLNENNKFLEDINWKKLKLNNNFRYLGLLFKVIPIVLKEKPTHIFTRDIVIAFICSFFNIKVAYEVHKEPKSKLAYILLKILRYKNNFKLIGISKALENYYLNFGFKKNSIFSYHDGVFLEEYDKKRNVSKNDLRKKLNLPTDKIIIMHTGSLYKGRDAELFKVILDNFKDILFVQVGGTRKDIEKYKQYYKNYNNIIFIEHQTHEKIIEYQMSADLLFYTLTKSNSLWWCTSPLKIFEYMATGIPILGSNIGSVGEILTKENAIIFNPEDKQTIIDGVQFFLENKEKAKELAKNALNDVRQKYTWRKRVEKILEFLR